MKIVLDTNIYIAAALKSGFSADIIDALTEIPDITAIISEEILTEIAEKLQHKFNRPVKEIDFILPKIF